jgi:hypothetical protein
MTRPTIAIALAAAAALLIVLAGLSRLAGAQRRAESAAARLTSLAADAQEVLDLRSRHATAAAGRRPPQDLIAQVTATLADAGLPADRLRAVEPQSDAPIRAGDRAGPPYRRQVMRLTLEPVSLTELGSVLNLWRTRQRVWAITHVELAATARPDQPDPAYRATLRLTATYADDTPTPTPPTRTTSTTSTSPSALTSSP